MTDDTRRALEIIKPFADEFCYEVTADKDKLYIKRYNYDAEIGISCNSTWATVMEFLGYLFMTQYTERFRPINLTKKQKDAIMRYIKM